MNCLLVNFEGQLHQKKVLVILIFCHTFLPIYGGFGWYINIFDADWADFSLLMIYIAIKR